MAGGPARRCRAAAVAEPSRLRAPVDARAGAPPRRPALPRPARSRAARRRPGPADRSGAVRARRPVGPGGMRFPHLYGPLPVDRGDRRRPLPPAVAVPAARAGRRPRAGAGVLHVGPDPPRGRRRRRAGRGGGARSRLRRTPATTTGWCSPTPVDAATVERHGRGGRRQRRLAAPLRGAVLAGCRRRRGGAGPARVGDRGAAADGPLRRSRTGRTPRRGGRPAGGARVLDALVAAGPDRRPGPRPAWSPSWSAASISTTASSPSATSWSGSRGGWSRPLSCGSTARRPPSTRC